MQHILLVSSDTGHQALVEKAIDRENCSIIALIETSANLAAELRSRAIDMVLMDLAWMTMEKLSWKRFGKAWKTSLCR